MITQIHMHILLACFVSIKHLNIKRFHFVIYLKNHLWCNGLFSELYIPLCWSNGHFFLFYQKSMLSFLYLIKRNCWKKWLNKMFYFYIKYMFWHYQWTCNLKINFLFLIFRIGPFIHVAPWQIEIIIFLLHFTCCILSVLHVISTGQNEMFHGDPRTREHRAQTMLLEMRTVLNPFRDIHKL